MRRLLGLVTSICLVIFVCLFVACGGGNSSNSAGNTANPGASGSGPGSSASGGSSGSGSASGTGSSGSGSGSGSSSGSGSGSGSSSSFVSFAYTASTSEIRAYGVSSDGSLTPASCSPYAFSTAQNTKIVTNGSNLYAIDAGQTNLNSFSIDKSTGSLNLANITSAIAGDPNQGDIVFRLALDHTGASLYAAVGTNINGGVNVFTVGGSSTAQQVQYFNGPSLPLSPEVFSSNNQYGYASACSARVEGIFGFRRASDGTLTTLNITTPQGPAGNSGEAFCPEGLAVSAKGYLAILWFPFAYASSGQVGNETYIMTYTINGDGTLTAISNSQVKTASSRTNTVAFNFDPTGSFLAVAGDGGVQTYSLNGSGTPMLVGPPQNAGLSFQSVAWDSANHIFATTSSQLYVFNSSTGVLTPASGSPYAGDQELAVLPRQ